MPHIQDELHSNNDVVTRTVHLIYERYPLPLFTHVFMQRPKLQIARRRSNQSYAGFGSGFQAHLSQLNGLDQLVVISDCLLALELLSNANVDSNQPTIILAVALRSDPYLSPLSTIGSLLLAVSPANRRLRSFLSFISSALTISVIIHLLPPQR